MTDITSTLCEAIKLNKCVELDYDGHTRRIEVHVVGKNSKTGNTLLRCFQVSGGSKSKQSTAWKLMDVTKISNYTITDIASEAPRPKYNPNDFAMSGGIFCHF